MIDDIIVIFYNTITRGTLIPLFSRFVPGLDFPDQLYTAWRSFPTGDRSLDVEGARVLFEVDGVYSVKILVSLSRSLFILIIRGRSHNQFTLF